MTGQEPARSAGRDQAGASRGRGRPARISRERIVAAARQLRPEAITLQAIAKLLQVDPTTLKYHVGDREGLLTLVALDIFETELATTPIPGTEDWQDAIRSYARALHEAAAKLGPLALSIPLRASAAVQSSLAHVETVLEALVDAGFSTIRRAAHSGRQFPTWPSPTCSTKNWSHARAITLKSTIFFAPLTAPPELFRCCEKWSLTAKPTRTTTASSASVSKHLYRG